MTRATLDHRTSLSMLGIVAALSVGLWVILWLAPGQHPAPSLERPLELSIAGTATQTGALAADSGSGGGAAEGRGTPDERGGRVSMNGTLEGLPWRGRVLEAMSGRPVAGARITLLDDTYEQSTESDATGAFTLTWPAERPARSSVVHPEYVDLRRPRTDFDEPALFKLNQSGALTGILRLDFGAELPGRDVALWSYALSRYRGEPDARCVTDDDGRFLFGDLDPGEYALAVVDDSSPLVFDPGILVRLGETVERDLNVEYGGRIQGRVTLRGRDESVVGARVRVRADQREISDAIEALTVQEALCGEDGAYVIAPVASGRNIVTVETPWGALISKSIEVTGDQESIECDIEVPVPASLRGQVRSADGKGVSAAAVILISDRAAGQVDWSAFSFHDEDSVPGQYVQCDRSGAFFFASAPARSKLVLVAVIGAGRAGGAVPTISNVLRLSEDEARTDYVLVVAQTAALVGSVEDSTGTPIAGALVRMQLRAGSDWTPLADTYSNAQGLFRFDGAPYARLQLTVEMPGYERSRREFLHAVGAPDLPPFSLKGGLLIEGWVLDEYGNAVTGAHVRAVRDVGAKELVRKSTLPDPFGRFRFEGLDQGVWSLTPKAAGWTSVLAEPTTVVLPGTESVMLLMRCEPREERATITGEICGARGVAVEGLSFSGLRGGLVTLDGTRFRASGLAPGRLKLVAKAAGHAPIVLPPVVLAPGALVDVGSHEMWRAGSLRVEVRGPNGKPISGAKVQLVRQSPGRLAPAEKGRSLVLKEESKGVYEAALVPFGQWQMRIKQKPFDTYSEAHHQRQKQQRVKLQLRERSKAKRKRK